MFLNNNVEIYKHFKCTFSYISVTALLNKQVFMIINICHLKARIHHNNNIHNVFKNSY